ncbi:MAG: class I SAM-dependent methyltransferase [Desulfobacca sp.]|nr:class I SAM-dependent methyltransferase [Desulfobacca sp.]
MSEQLVYSDRELSYREKLVYLLSQELDFHCHDSNYASHDFHAFPAKFPPQLPRKFILELTNPADLVLDPMMGSGTAVLEAYINGRHGVGVDIDPLALKIAKAKVTPLEKHQIYGLEKGMLHQANFVANHNQIELKIVFERTFDAETRKFINKWFAPETQINLFALLQEIRQIPDSAIRNFFEVVFSAIIITKSGGVSLAYDLAHTRPHLAKAVINKNGEIIYLGNNVQKTSKRRLKLLTKPLRNVLEEFDKRFHNNLKNLPKNDFRLLNPTILCADAQSLPFADASADLIVTSPPYAANAIDYMRSHKFSLAWLGFAINDLSNKRKDYIGGEVLQGVGFEELPAATETVVNEMYKLDHRKGRVLHRYYSEMTRTLREMFRVLKAGKAAIVVVGSSIMRGRDTEIQSCLADIGQTLGFEVPKIGVRNLDRNRRMLPAGLTIDRDSQIQQRMHKEYVIGFYKPR